MIMELTKKDIANRTALRKLLAEGLESTEYNVLAQSTDDPFMVDVVHRRTATTMSFDSRWSMPLLINMLSKRCFKAGLKAGKQFVAREMKALLQIP